MSKFHHQQRRLSLLLIGLLFVSFQQTYQLVSSQVRAAVARNVVEDSTSTTTNNNLRRRTSSALTTTEESTNNNVKETSDPSTDEIQSSTIEEAPVLTINTVDDSTTTTTDDNNTTTIVWNPQFYNDPNNNMTNHLARGMNVLTAKSGCNFAAWVVTGGGFYRNDCFHSNAKQILPQDYTNLSSIVQPYDTIYVPVRSVPDFVKNALPHLEVPIVLLSGQFHFFRPYSIANWVYRRTTENPYVVKWFIHNVEYYRELFNKPNATNEIHEKISFLPFGVQSEPYKRRHANPASIFRDAMIKYSQTSTPEKSNGIFIGYINPFTNKDRANMPSGEKLPLPEYYEGIANSRFVLSPRGDRPECYRHYESIGLGAIPITDLNEELYPHLSTAPVIYNTNEWNTITEEKALEKLGVDKFPHVNRNMALEEYWIEYIEREVGRPLRWWDRVAERHSTLQKFQLDYDNIPNLLSKYDNNIEQKS